MAGTPSHFLDALALHDLEWKWSRLTQGLADSRCIPPQNFINHFLPKPPLATAKEMQIYLTNHDIWKKYDSCPPAASTSSGDDIFAPFAALFNDVLAHYTKVTFTEPTMTMRCDSGKALEGSGLRSNSPSGVLVPIDAPPIINWNLVGATFEFKKTRTLLNWEDNVKKILWSMAYIMANDCCRRFTFGVTVDNTAMRLWFCDRSGFVISDRFDFLKNPALVVRIFILLGTASQTELGYDPSITRIYVNGAEQLDIEVHSEGETRTFRTLRLLSNSATDRVRSRATRVWVVHEKDDPSKQLVLKDVWVEDDRRREGDIYKEVLDSVQEEDKERARAHFLDPMCHGDVRVVLRSGERVVDNTRDTVRQGYIIPRAAFSASLFRISANTPLVSKVSNTDDGSVPELSAGILDDIDGRTFHARTHYRIVFDGVGVSAKDLMDMTKILKALEGAANGLDILDKYDLIHRDVSISNILLVNNVGKIADFEFVQKTRQGGVRSDAFDKKQHPGCVGTRPFMASEVQYGIYRYSKLCDPRVWTFFQNTIHDAEALWWVIVWILVWTSPAVSSAGDVGDHRTPMGINTTETRDASSRADLNGIDTRSAGGGKEEGDVESDFDDEDKVEDVEIEAEYEDSPEAAGDVARLGVLHDLFPSADQPTTLSKREIAFNMAAEFQHQTACLPEEYQKLRRVAEDLRARLFGWYSREREWTDEGGPDECVFKGIYSDVVLPPLRRAIEENGVGELRFIG
ncbi:hypothetical protein BOTBODRAFT_50929 [Botryobasidium botryosum FD-172 SS1]|uniref:Protein kinase domain-containing protein n=1 Tax=Botryobasidium botryosum (strain FD-172 SS1) TaxID=930990 RepID=A0A067MYS6_BOTB1|nr:hypothetical protein BOTBODRAFT_50929 [Botryobasidium botryosum FD-172 SS1]